MNKRLGGVAAAALLTMAAAAPAFVFAQDNASALPAATTVGNASFISGGIGLDESEAMKAAASNYALELVFSAKSDGKTPGASAAYTADVKVKITDRAGKTVIDTVSQGPYLLANLPDGVYQVEASADGGTVKIQKVTVKKGAHQRLVFSWAE